jgi:hypothetical protein
MIPKSKTDWLQALRRCGLSEALIEFVLGEPADPLFEANCERQLLEQPFEYLPDVPGPPVTPLWHVTTTVVGCRKKGKAWEFVEAAMEEVFGGGAEPVKVIAHSEQGLWAWLFRKRLDVAFLRTGKRKTEMLDQLRAAADRVGFLHFDEAVERVKSRGGYDEFILALK